MLQRRLKKKQKGSKNRQKLNQKIARLHQRISDARKDWHFKLAHHLCDGAGMIFVEDINFVSWQRGMLSKHSADAGFGQFVTVLQWVCWKRDVYFAKVNKDGTSQECPQCGAHTGKKTLEIRVHSCPECGYVTSRDVAAAQVVRNRGMSEVGQSLDIKRCDPGESNSPSGQTRARFPRYGNADQERERAPRQQNACRDGLTGTRFTLSSQESVKQETQIVRSGHLPLERLSV